MHRDLKPENIMLTQGVGAETEDSVCTSVKIIDFGISAEIKGHGATGSLVSERAGTLLYMAPEQLTKVSHSKKVDLWACGVLMYQLLC